MIPHFTKLWHPSTAAEKMYEERKPSQDKATRAAYGRDATPYEVFLKTFGDLPLRNAQKHEFLILCWQHQWPNFLVMESRGVVNDWLIRMARGLCFANRLILMGCGSCVSGDTRILNPITCENPTVLELMQSGIPPTVMTMFGPAVASVPFLKGFADLYEVKLTNGKSFTCTAHHRVLTPQGYRMVSELSCGDFLGEFEQSHPASILGNDPSTHASNDLNFRKKAVGSPENYLTCFHPDDELPRLEEGIGQSFFPSQADARKRNACTSERGDVLVRESACIHPYLLSTPACKPHISLPVWQSEISGQTRSSLKKHTPLDRWFQFSSQFHSENDLPEPSLEQDPDDTHSDLFYNSAYLEQMGSTWGVSVSVCAVESIRKTHSGAYFDLVVPNAHHYFAEGAIHHNSGKTQITAAYCYTVWKARPFNSSVFLSTTSAEAGESRTWGAVKDLHKADKYRIGKRIESLHLITLDEEIRDEDGVKERDFRDVIKCINIKPGQEGKNVIAAIVGRKNDIVLWACDELPFMDVGVLAARVNLNTNPINQFIGLGNAPEEGDPMYIDATPFGDKFPDGWRSVDKDVHQSWPTEKGLCLYFNGATSPNFRSLDNFVPFPKLMNERFRLEILRDAGGEDSPMYWKQFYGFPPGNDISDKLLTINLLKTNGAFCNAVWADTNKVSLAGLDLGFRTDGDPCIIQFGKVGLAVAESERLDDAPVPKYRKMLWLERDGVRLVPSQGVGDSFEVQIAKKVLSECGQRGCHDLALDVSGDGGILMQHIERQAREEGYTLNVLPVSFMGSPEDRVVIPGEKRKAREMFSNMVAQLWGIFRLSVLNKVILGMEPHSNCVKQFCARKMVTDEKRKLGVEPKKEMKKRIRRSPDHADAAAILTHLAMRHGLAGMEAVVAKKPFNPDEILRAAALGSGRSGSGRYQEHRTIYGGR